MVRPTMDGRLPSRLSCEAFGTDPLEVSLTLYPHGRTIYLTPYPTSCTIEDGVTKYVRRP